MSVRVVASSFPAVGSPCGLAGQGSADLLDMVGEWFGCTELAGVFAPCKGCLLEQGRVRRYPWQVLERVGEGCRVAEEAEGGASARRKLFVQYEGEA